MTRKSRDGERTDEFMRTLVHELANMPDNQVLEGEDVNQLLDEGVSLLATVTEEAGRRRLARAREKLTAVRGSRPNAAVGLSAAEARAKLRQLSNTTVFTLAARELSDMSDDDVLRLYQQVMDLMDDLKNQS
jgi:hypothetical protein